jgi:lysophospholipid acyltransferase (LPLAT)-like uncharacterized protein
MQAQWQTWSMGWRERLLIGGLSWLLRGLYATIRPVYVQQQFERRVRHTGKPILLTFWHGRMVYFLHLYRHQRFTVLVSQSRDGELISQVLAQFGIHATRGSSSRGGTRAVVELVKRMRQGFHVAITPDGPRGPRYQVQPGIVLVAQKTGVPILPAAYNARWKSMLGSWDDFILPLPFSRVVVVYGEPIYVPRGAPAATLQAKRLEVEASLQYITKLADEYFCSKR